LKKESIEILHHPDAKLMVFIFCGDMFRFDTRVGKEQPMEEKKFRSRVTWYMFLLSILVIWVHSYNIVEFSGGQAGPLWERAEKIQSFVAYDVGQAAVPGFFLLSAYLFFRNFAWGKLLGKWKERVFSVLVPYAAWNTLYYLGYAAATGIPGIRQIVGKEPVPLGVMEFAEAILHYKYAPVFWYLYQLIILILLSPAVYLLIKNRIVGAAWLAFLVVAIHFHLDTQHPNTDALFYYSLAAYLAVHGRALVERPWDRRQFLAGVGAAVLGGICYWKMQVPGADVLWIIGWRLCVPAAVWLLFPGDRVGEGWPWMRQSLFIYAIHFPVVRFGNKVSARVLLRFLGEPAMMAVSMVIFFVIPGIVVAVSYAAALFLGRFMPVVWKILAGGRSLKERRPKPGRPTPEKPEAGKRDAQNEGRGISAR